MVVKQQVVIIRYTRKILVFAQGKGAACQRSHLWLVVPEEGFQPGEGLSFQLPVVDLRYFFLYVTVDLFQAEISLLLQILQQMGLQVLDMLFNSCLPSRLTGGGGRTTTS